VSTAGLDERVRAELVTLAERLRDAGVDVPADGSLAAAEALSALDEIDRRHVRAALRATLCRRPRDRETFDRLFAVFWARVRGGEQSYVDDDGDDPTALGTEADAAADAPGQTEADESAPVGGATGGSLAGGVGAADRSSGAGSAYSADGASRPVELDDVGDPDVRAAVAAFTDALASLPGRRWAPGDGEPDVKRALRRSVSQGGVPLPLPERERDRSAARGVVLVDVSGSVLDAVDEGALIATLRGIRARWRRTPIFFFDTRLRDVSEAFDAPTAEAAADALETARVEWGGGTRIAEALATLRETRPDAVDRRSVVLVVSDGIERGDVAGLREELSWLARRAGCVLWLNPLARDPKWSPAAPGMRVALPLVDGLYAFADADDLERIATAIARRGPERRAAEASAR